MDITSADTRKHAPETPLQQCTQTLPEMCGSTGNASGERTSAIHPLHTRQAVCSCTGLLGSFVATMAHQRRFHDLPSHTSGAFACRKRHCAYPLIQKQRGRTAPNLPLQSREGLTDNGADCK
uniref:Uncharacterized protein n=1 Tax=Eutreptiella gymnastica TaxID=73025 RepID=A0A7S4CU53_9EUGL